MAVFPRENFIPLRHLAEQTNNIVQWTEFDRGGHFPAMEEPDLLVADIRAFFGKIRRASPGSTPQDQAERHGRQVADRDLRKVGAGGQRRLAEP